MIPIPPLNISAGGGKSESGDASTGAATNSFQFIKNLNLGGSGTATQSTEARQTQTASADSSGGGGKSSNMALYIVGAIAIISLIANR